MDVKRFNEITTWQYITFPTSTSLTMLKHLKKEIAEVETAISYEEMKAEFADCFILLFGSARAAGLNYQEILESIDAKMVINRERKWGEPDKDGVINHIKDDALLEEAKARLNRLKDFRL